MFWKKRPVERSLSYRLILRWLTFVFSRADKTQYLIFGIAYLRLRDHYKVSLEDDPRSPLLKEAVEAFFSWEADSTPSDDVEEYYRWLYSDSDSMANRKAHYQIQYRLRSNTEEGHAIAARYRQLYGENIVELDDAAILKKHSAFKKQRNKTRRRYRRNVAVRIQLSITDLAYAVPVISVMIALGGYFYTSRVYTHFGIVASHFFTAGDYLSASVHAVEAAAISAVMFVASMTWRVVSDANMTRYERKKYATQDLWMLGIVIASCVYILFTADDAMRATVWFGMALFVIGVNIITYLLDRVFQSSMAIVSIVAAAVVFASMLYVQSNREIMKIEREDNTRDFRVLVEDSEFTSDEYSIVGSSGKYLFLWRRDESRVEVIPHATIRWMSLSAESE